MDAPTPGRPLFVAGSRNLNPPSGVGQVALDRAGALVAMSDHTGRVWLYATADGAPRGVLEGAPEDRAWWMTHGYAARSLAVAPDGRAVALHQGGRLCVWDATGRAPRWTADLPEARPRAVAFSPDGRTLVVGGAFDALRAFDAATGAPRWTCALQDDRGDPARHLAVACSPDGTRAVAAQLRVAHVVDLADGRALRALSDRPFSTNFPQGAARFSADGARVLTVFDDAGVRVWDAATGKRVRQNAALRKRLPVRPNGIAWVGEERVLVALDRRPPRLFDAGPGAAVAHALPELRAVATSDDGRVGVVVAAADARVLDLATMTPTLVTRPRTQGGVGFADGGARLRVGTAAETLETWDWRAGERVDEQPHGAAVVSPGGRYAAAHDGARRRWDVRDLATGRVATRFEGERHEDSFAFAGDDSRVAHARYGQGVTEVALPRAKPRTTLAAPDPSQLPAYSRDGSVLALLGGDGVLRWRAGAGALTAAGATFTFQSLALDPSGRACVVTTDEGRVLVRWDLAADAEVARAGVGGFVWRMAIDPTGAVLAVAYEGAVELRDATTLALRARLPEASYPLAFTLDGRHVATGGSCVSVWEVPPPAGA